MTQTVMPEITRMTSTTECRGRSRHASLGLGVAVMVHLLIVNQMWEFSIPTSNSLRDIFRDIQEEIQPQCEFDDEIVWILEEDGHFTLKSTYHIVTGNCDQNLQWAPLIWFKGCIRKHSICAWMFLRGKLKTKDFLLQRNVDCDSCCVLCDCTWESGSHLMLQCSYSQTVWSLLLAKLNLSSIVCNWPIELLESILL